MNKRNIIISEFGLISSEYPPNHRYLSAQVSQEFFRELEKFAKTDGGKNVLQFANNGKCLQAKNYIGTIQTKSGFSLEILPKTATHENIATSKEIFMKLLHLLYRLPNYKNIDEANFERIKNLNIFEIFIFMFLEEVAKIIQKGIKSDYVIKEDNLYYLKGRLLVNKQIKHNGVHKERFFVAYDEYSQNRAENKLIKTTLKHLALVSKDYSNQRRIRQYLEHMIMVDYSHNIEADFRLLKAGRDMANYSNALIWARVFLKKESFSSFSGDTVAFAILYPMEKLFECFVEWWLNKEYPEYQIRAQDFHRDFVKYVFGIKPDFIIKNNNDEVVSVADAKWKIIEEIKNFAQSDFYQLYAYSKIFKIISSSQKIEKNNIASLILYYPMSDYLQSKQTYSYFDKQQIEIIPIDLTTELCGQIV